MPGSTPELFGQTTSRPALGLGPSHLSCYGLVYEKGTALWKQLQAGRSAPSDEEAEREMYAHTIDRLAAAGLDQYEISNFARPGEECRHNLVYWTNDAYYGVGLGAARYVDGVRSVNTRDLPAYLKRIEADEPATGPTETLDSEAPRPRDGGADAQAHRRRARPRRLHMANRLRTRWLAEKTLKRSVGARLAGRRRPAIRFTREGLFLADSVLCDLL